MAARIILPGWFDHLTDIFLKKKFISNSLAHLQKPVALAQNEECHIKSHFLEAGMLPSKLDSTPP